MNKELIDNAIRRVPDFPKPGILFYDITGLMLNPEAFRETINAFCDIIAGRKQKVTAIAGLEARGFIFGGAIAERLGIPFILVRKKGKLPGKTVSQDYALEYGTAEIEVHVSDVKPSDNIVLIDDLIATGGTLDAARKLIQKCGASVDCCLGVIGLPELNFAKALEGTDVVTLIDYCGK
ncbi:MAG: adenine phosphoribosyltransferase [Bacteroidales bacterium]|nr:adenine phosphoribosyltransferase [Bacteroidales bacterium]